MLSIIYLNILLSALTVILFERLKSFYNLTYQTGIEYKLIAFTEKACRGRKFERIVTKGRRNERESWN